MAPGALVSRTVSVRQLSITALALLLGPVSLGYAQSGPRWQAERGARVSSAGPALAQLTTIKAVRSISQGEAAKGYRVRLRGIVTHFDEQADTGLIIHDGRFGQYVLPPADMAAVPAWWDLSAGRFD